jgi:hypothetical protein
LQFLEGYKFITEDVVLMADLLDLLSFGLIEIYAEGVLVIADHLGSAQE